VLARLALVHDLVQLTGRPTVDGFRPCSLLAQFEKVGCFEAARGGGRDRRRARWRGQARLSAAHVDVLRLLCGLFLLFFLLVRHCWWCERPAVAHRRGTDLLRILQLL
jgi:hypothetical protein